MIQIVLNGFIFVFQINNIHDIYLKTFKQNISIQHVQTIIKTLASLSIHQFAFILKNIKEVKYYTLVNDHVV